LSGLLRHDPSVNPQRISIIANWQPTVPEMFAKDSIHYDTSASSVPPVPTYLTLPPYRLKLLLTTLSQW